MKSVALLLTALLGLAAVQPAGASGYDLKSYRELTKAESPEMAAYLTGVGTGLFWANAALQARNQQPLFCMPEKLAVDPNLIKSLLDQQIKNPGSGKPYADDKQIEIILLVSFMSRFPCGEA